MTREALDELELLATKKRFKLTPGEASALDVAIKVLDQQPYEDAISRKAAIDAVRKNTFRLTFAEEQGGEGHAAWSAEAIYSDVIEGALLELSPVPPQPKRGLWWERETYPQECRCWDCSECKETVYEKTNYCPNCGATMGVKA